MEPNYLVIALIVGLCVAIAVSAISVVVWKRKHSGKKTEALVRRFIAQKAENRAKTRKELGRLEALYAKGDVDKETYDRLKSVLVTVKKKEDEEADVVEYVMSKRKS